MSSKNKTKLHKKPSFKKYRFAPEIVKELRTCYALDNYHGILQVLEDWLVISTSIAISILAWDRLNIIFCALIYLVSVVVIGSRHHALADLLHQSAHGTLAKNKLLNRFLGTYLSGYLILQSFTGYTSSHIKNHHPYLGSDDDPDYDGLLQNGLYGTNFKNGEVKHYLANLINPMTSLKYMRYLAKYRLFNPNEEKAERIKRLSFLTVVVSIIVWFGFGNLLFAYWVVPFFTTANWTGALVELSEHYPLMKTAPKIDIYMSRNRLSSPFENFFLGKHWDGYHLVHHKFQNIPSWNYKKAHQILLQDAVYAQINQDNNGWIEIIGHMMSPTEIEVLGDVES